MLPKSPDDRGDHGCVDQLLVTSFTPYDGCVIGDKMSATTLVPLGDSHALPVRQRLRRALQEAEGQGHHGHQERLLPRGPQDHTGGSGARIHRVPRRELEREVAEEYGATVINTLPAFCAEGYCPAVIGGHVVYWDNSHMTGGYAESLEPTFEQALAV